MNITWNSTGMTNAYIFIMLIDSNYDSTYIIPSATENDGSYSWDIPSTLTPGQYKINIAGVIEGIVGAATETESAESFNIIAPVTYKTKIFNFQLFQTGSILDAIRSLFR